MDIDLLTKIYDDQLAKYVSVKEHQYVLEELAKELHKAFAMVGKEIKELKKDNEELRKRIEILEGDLK